MQSTLMAEWLSEEHEVKLIVMWQAQPELYEVISKEYSNRNKRMLVDEATHIFFFLFFLNMRLILIIILLLLVSNNIG